MRELAPGIGAELLAANDIRDLRRREADLAIRHARPDQPELIAKLERTSSAHFFVAKAYLDRHRRSRTADDLLDASFIGFVRWSG